MFGARFRAPQTLLITFMKVLRRALVIFNFVCYLKIVTDFLLSTELIPNVRLEKWINRKGFRIRKALILKWIFLGNVLTMAYKSTLLSTLITIRYNMPIDTLADFDSSGLPMVVAKGTAIHSLLKSDPRAVMKQIYNRTIVFEHTPESESKYAQM